MVSGPQIEQNSMIICYINNDFSCIIDDRKIASTYAFLIGNNLISWESKKYPVVLICSTEKR